MPELPDVAGFKKYLDAQGLHQTIARTTVSDERLLENASPQSLGRQLKGHGMVSTRRHGKFLFAKLDSDDWVVLHFGMSGNLASFADDEEMPRYARVIFHFENGRNLAVVSRRLLGRVAVVDDAAAYLSRHDVGPDALNDVSEENFTAILAGHRGMLKTTLMNQSVLSGIGNIYADEILFQAGLHPKTRSGELTEAAAHRLYRVMKDVLRTAADKDAVVADLPEHFLLPHRDSDERCPACGAQLETIKVSSRTSHYCPSCQKR